MVIQHSKMPPAIFLPLIPKRIYWTQSLMIEVKIEGNVQAGSDFCMILQHRCLVTLMTMVLLIKGFLEVSS